MSPDDPRHGEYRGYRAGCRCPDCVDAHRVYQRNRRKVLTVPALLWDPQPWAAHAACNGASGSHWFPEPGESANQARLICSTCPVRDECLRYALDNNEAFGIWGGMSARERRQLVAA